MNHKKILILIAISIILKSSLFLFAAIKAPEVKIKADTHLYLSSGMSLASDGVFGKVHEDGSVSHQYYRTPGYPLFLGLFHGLLKIPLNGIIFLQLLLTLLSAFITFKTANRINPKLGILALCIILFDPAITIYSLMLLTESLFLLLMSIFMYTMVRYLDNKKKTYLLWSALVLAVATYVRPITYYLSIPLTLLICFSHFKESPKKNITHAFIFIITVYVLLFAWQWRNMNHFKNFQFSNPNNATINMNGLYKSYHRNEDLASKDLPPVAYYLNVGSRSTMSLMTRPASLKNFNSPVLKKAGKIFSYPWIAFWLIGFLTGISKFRNNTYLIFLLLVISYLAGATVVGAMWGARPRFRVPMMPYIAILSSAGWTWLLGKNWKSSKN